MALPSGLAWHELFWPNYRYRRPRQRTYATLHTHNAARGATIVTEDDRVYDFDFGTAADYERMASVVAGKGLTVYTTFVDGIQRFPWLSNSLQDPKATLYASERKGVVGVRIQRGKRSGTFVSSASWHRDEFKEQTDDEFLGTLRRVAQRLGVGAHDTAAAMGTAALYRYWTEANLPHVLRLSTTLQDVFLRYRIGGRVTTEGVGGFYPHLHEYDIRQAYPSVAAHGVPWGQVVYEPRDPRDTPWDDGPVFGVWNLHVYETIEHSPIPLKEDWSQLNGNTTYRLEPGLYPYAGWSDEIAALDRAGGCRSQYLYGFRWHSLSRCLSPWVDEMAAYRDACEHDGDRHAAELVKLATNATIGRFGSDPHLLEVVSMEDTVCGDTMLQLPAWAFLDSPGEPPTTFMHHQDGLGKATPLHWCSYIRMRIRLEIHAQSQAGRAAGAVIVMENFDALVSTQPLVLRPTHFQYKAKYWFDARIPYPRALTGYQEDTSKPGERIYVRMLPGVPKVRAGP